MFNEIADEPLIEKVERRIETIRKQVTIQLDEF